MTDRCNLRCTYCMPADGVVFEPRANVLRFEEITRVVRLLSTVGVSSVRLTGGEPLLRKDLPTLVHMLASIDGVDDLAMTTNAVLLEPVAAELRRAGLNRLNISIDALDPDVNERLTRRRDLPRTIRGIGAAIDAGFDSIKLNALAIAGVTPGEVHDLVRFAIDRGVEMRFIEYMPLDADGNWDRKAVLTGETLLTLLREHFGDVRSLGRPDVAAPAERYAVRGGVVGIIRSVTRPFCGSCDRLRLTADGSIRNCLFSDDEEPIRDRMRAGADDAEILSSIRRCIARKAAGHGIGDESFRPPSRPMYSIGG